MCGSPLVESPSDKGRVEGLLSRADMLQRLAPKKYVEQLLASSGRIAGERRVITILFLDIKGSTAMAENLDPEEVMEIMNAAFEDLIAPIYRYEGTVARIMGDAVLAFFGAPIAHEDDAARACRTSLEIIDRAREHATKLEHERGITGFDVRVGINTGLVVVGEVGTDLRVEYTAMGDAVNLAKRMESAAEPGTVMITGNTHKLIAELFETENLGRIQVKGRTKPVEVFRLLRLKPERVPGRCAGEAEEPMFGRDTELEQLLSAVDALRQGRGGTLAVTGGPGLGKTRLVSEVRRLHTGEVTWAEGYCVSYAQNMSYWVARDLLYGMLGVNASVEPTELRTALDESLKRLDIGENDTFGAGRQSREVIRTYLARLLDLPLYDTPATPEPESMRADIQQTFCDYIRFLSRAQPVVLAWHDIHWIDPSSLELLETLVPLTSEVPLLVILIFRTGEERIQDFHERMLKTRSECYRVIELQPLEHDAGKSLLKSLLKEHEIPKETFDLILDHAQGNAFFMEEVVRFLRDGGLLDPRRDRAITAQQIKELGIPTTLHGAVMAHIDRLPPQDKRILQTASVIGRVFDRGVLSETLDPSITDRQLEMSLYILCQRGFIEQQSMGEAPGETTPGSIPMKDVSLWRTLPIRFPRGSTEPSSGQTAPVHAEYYFKNPALAEVTYNSLLKSQRRELHRRAGNAMEAIYLDRKEELAPVLAYHFEKGGEAEKAFHYLVHVSRRAASMHAHREAIAGFSKAITLAHESMIRLSGSPEHFGTEVTAVHEELGDVYFVVGEYQSAVEQYGRAQEGASDGHHRARLHRKMGQAFEKWGKYGDAKASFEAGLTELGEVPDNSEAAYIYTGLGLTHYHLGELNEAVDLCSRALEIMEGLENERGIAYACNNLAIIYCKKCEWDTSLSQHRRCISIWERIGDTYGLAASHNNIGLTLKGRGDWQQAVEHFEKSLELFERLGNRHGLARAYDNLGQVYMEQDQVEKATDYVQKAFTILTEMSKDRSEISPELWQSGAW